MQATNETSLKCSACGGVGYFYEPKLRDCQFCEGVGLIEGEKCFFCNGDGSDNSAVHVGCLRCAGTGRLPRP